MVLLIAFTPMFTSCNSDSDNVGVPTETFMVFATLTAANDSGCTFTTSEPDKSDIITYTSTQKLKSEEVTVGKRYILAFVNDSQKMYQSGEITVFGLMPIFNGDAELRNLKNINEMMKDPIRVTLATRTGDYFNFEATSPVDKSPKKFTIAFDETTRDDAYPHAYLVYQSDNFNVADRTFYGSFNISSVLSLPTCEGVKLTYYNAQGALTTETFDKGKQSLRPVE